MFLNALQTLSDRIKTSFSLILPDANEIKFGEQYGKPVFQGVIHSDKGLRALKSGHELQICEAYIDGDIDLNGHCDMLKLLEITNFFASNHPLLARFAHLKYFFCNQIAVNRGSIAKHYEFDNDFYLLFLDKTRAYSHGIFLHDDEPLEIANTRKLEFAMTSCHLVPGAKVLDLGAGWGSAVEFLGSRNIHVDALTISNQSFSFVSKLIQTKKLPHCRILQKDFLEFNLPGGPLYDALFSLGTLEHLPNYCQVLRQCDALLKSGGYAYFDASAIASHNPMNSYFIDRHVFPGNHTCLDIYRFLNAVAASSFELISLHNDTHNYYLTLKAWAENLDHHKDEIMSRWSKRLYRIFQLYLWGCCYGMLNNRLNAYRIVLRKPL